MNEIFSQWRNMPPIVVSYNELRAILLPLAIGYAWGENTIHDLWIMGAPAPQDVTRRIVFPGKLAEWLADVLARQGHSLDVGAQAYIELRKRTH